jgi:hypothetical protein
MTGKKRAIRNALYHLGLHATPKGVVDALAQLGIQVDEELVRLVRFEMLREISRARVGKAPTPATSPVVRYRPRTFPARQGRGASR